MAPAHLIALLVIHTDPVWNVSTDVLWGLRNVGLIEMLGGRYQTTPKGQFLINMLCETPMPVRVERWVDPREKA